MFIGQPNKINEDELKYIFAGPKKKKKASKVKAVFKYTLLTLFFAVVVFVGINYQALYEKFSYWYKNEFRGAENINQTQNITTDQKEATISIPSFANNHLFIPKISIDAPITWSVKNTGDETGKALEKGVVHLFGTALPGTVGNVIITGHSSNYAWAAGEYKAVFSLLNQLVVGDPIFLNYQNKPFAYKVFEKRVVKPDDLSALDQGDDSNLSLVTCTPVGTTLNRLIVSAKQLYPNPKNNVKSDIENQNTQLPNIR